MKHIKLVLTALTLTAVLLFILIVGPSVEAKLTSNKTEGRTVSELNKEDSKSASSDISVENQEQEELLTYGFNLKYDKYLVEAPYTYVVNGEERCFQFDVMREKIAVAETGLSKYRLTYIDNYKNRNGYAPFYKGGTVDPLGTNRSAAAPAYADINNLNEFIYLEDGTLVEVLEEDEDYTLVAIVGTGNEYSVPSRYVPTDDCLTQLKKVVVVDRTNQNIATFEKEDQWNVTSYSMATTGKEGKYHELTPLGYYYAIERKVKFFYVKDGTNEIEGYAPYAVRFSGGAYIHGVSVGYKYAEDGTQIDPGLREFSSSIGTVPLSHKCVRNYTSHAKFIYDWYEHGKTIVIVIE
ncbi:MAG: L,D-transpeptidase [Aminipila sp.]